jgi:cysteine desulfurase family protein (TIGR01976 family)
MTASVSLDLDFVRGQFPAMNDWAYFDNAGGSMVPRTVVDRITANLSETRMQPSGGSPYARRANDSHELAIANMAEMINADTDEVMIGGSTTINMYVLAHALRPMFAPGDEVIVTNLDHEANNGAWRRLEEVGAVVREWQVNTETCELDVADLEALLNERTKLVCFTHCSNITGTLLDVAPIVKKIHDAGALACVDAVAYSPHRRLDVKETDVDFYALSLYKLYGPHQSILYGKREHLLAAKGQNHYFKTEEDIPDKLDLGGVNHDLMAGIPGIVEYFDLVHEHHFPGSNADLRERLGEVFGLFAAQEETLATRFAAFLNSKPNLRVIGRATGDAAQRAPTFAFVVDGRDSTEFPEHLLKHKVSILADDFYAARLIDALDLRRKHNGVVRCSMVHYNTMDEVDRLIAGLDEII